MWVNKVHSQSFSQNSIQPGVVGITSDPSTQEQRPGKASYIVRPCHTKKQKLQNRWMSLQGVPMFCSMNKRNTSEKPALTYKLSLSAAAIWKLPGLQTRGLCRAPADRMFFWYTSFLKMYHKKRKLLTQERSVAARVAWSVILAIPVSHSNAPGTQEKKARSINQMISHNWIEEK